MVEKPFVVAASAAARTNSSVVACCHNRTDQMAAVDRRMTQHFDLVEFDMDMDMKVVVESWRNMADRLAVVARVVDLLDTVVC